MRKDSPPVRTANHAELVVLGKGTVTLDVLVDGKPEVVNFCNVLMLLSWSTIFFQLVQLRKLVFDSGQERENDSL